ncbi:DUF2730 family protein [Sphingobium sp. SA2]|uniref:DUF2730 family protein n=1 Tax=Sphingobium sp. SA2 TaxID=1524832 RepID=UPI0028C0039C|nr:DUF2730 family protein [Sphingobium sp. SA2]MDT7533747.1 DUF2730 family protein [Sphingobium sp. SA2]
MSNTGIFPAILALLVSLLNIAWTWHMRSQSAAADRVTKLETRLDLVEDRQISVEEQLKHLPTKDDIGAIRIQLEHVLGKIGRQESEISKIDRVLNRIDDYLRAKA